MLAPSGLAIRGLVRHHKVDPLDYDKVSKALAQYFQRAAVPCERCLC